ncbi:MAG: 4-(cytidine 5'-diphospho)-2-C-methyl-D-erythritol kinase [Spirochaetes bacterium]|nr:4-(cytidine 5'-diphospho)-2-C-methyl-D-erythritol kinase [Spirochaetota bacterium]
MAELDLHDILNVESYTLSDNPKHVSVKIIDKGIKSSSILKDTPSEKNLITIAVKKYLSLINKGGDFTFSIIKNIPSGAGLGGGSSNAAAALKIVSELFGRGIDSYVTEAAINTGSDVPFFFKGGFAFVEGKGEHISPIEIYSDSHILLVNNGIHVNTGDAYNSLKREISDREIDCIDKKREIEKQIGIESKWKDIFSNDFEATIFNIYPQIGLIKEKMYKNGAIFASMSGSGSSIFGIFNDKNSAKDFKKTLEKQKNRVYYTKFHQNIN